MKTLYKGMFDNNSYFFPTADRPAHRCLPEDGGQNPAPGPDIRVLEGSCC